MLIYKNINTEYTIGIWQITEPADALLDLLDKNEADLLRSMNLAESRLLEKAAIRVLLAQLAGNEAKIAYRDNGKPYLESHSLGISISHTKGYAAILLADSNHLGIDIEYVSDRVNRIRSRFISNEEYINQQDETMHLLLHWSAKETMYKALSMDKIDLKNDFRISRFEPAESGTFLGQENFSQKKLCFQIQYITSADYVLTYTMYPTNSN